MPDYEIKPKLTFCMTYVDGRTTALIAWPNGEWKKEVFASEDHARQFAAEHNMEIIDARNQEA